MGAPGPPDIVERPQEIAGFRSRGTGWPASGCPSQNANFQYKMPPPHIPTHAPLQTISFELTAPSLQRHHAADVWAAIQICICIGFGSLPDTIRTPLPETGIDPQGPGTRSPGNPEELSDRQKAKNDQEKGPSLSMFTGRFLSTETQPQKPRL